MKKIITLLSGALAIFTSCGISASYTSSDGGQRFADGIYSSSPTRKDKLAEQDSKAGLQELAEQTKASQIYLFGDRKDTVMIPENMAATIRYDRQLGTSVTVAEFDPYDFTYGWYTDRYRWNSYWNLGMWNSVYYRGWYDPWHYGSIHSPWYYGGFHNPWYYAGYYDPWYYGGWYDPWYYGYGWHGWYDPFYGYMHPHYCGWYGGWDPYYHHHHHHHHHISYPSSGTVQHREVYRGSRLETSGNRVLAGGSSSKPSSGAVTRRVSTTSRSSFGTSRTASTREATGRRPAASSQTSSRPAATYRRPAGTAPRVSGSSAPYSRSSSTSGGTSTYSRSSSSSSSSSSYSRSYSTPSRSSYSSGSSGGGYSRSSSGGGGGYSRSSSGGRR